MGLFEDPFSVFLPILKFSQEASKGPCLVQGDSEPCPFASDQL